MTASIRPGAPTTRVWEGCNALRLLDPLETYWAYPGRGWLQQLREMYEEADFESAAQIAGTSPRASPRTSGTPRRPSSAEPRAPPARAPESTWPPAFEVPVVDDVFATEDQALREEMRRLRRPKDPFT